MLSCIQNLVFRRVQVIPLIAIHCVLHRPGNQTIQSIIFIFSYSLSRSSSSFFYLRRFYYRLISSCFKGFFVFLMILPQVHLRKPCYDFSFLQIKRFKSISPTNARVLEFHLHIQSVGATGGVYKGQGRIHLELVTRYYKEFLVQNK